ncbi:hypothetical protein M3484_20905 [Pseudomonas sp. GX19020]|nr:hypothetical protein [Pseudomonas sp. GX19020]MCL4069021.1 hypothetical protein [Pseudomonas sp. GX19020]
MSNALHLDRALKLEARAMALLSHARRLFLLAVALLCLAFASLIAVTIGL